MVTSYSRMYFMLTQDLGDLLRIFQENRGKYIGMRAQQIYKTTQIHIALEETYGRYHLHPKSARSHLF